MPSDSTWTSVANPEVPINAFTSMLNPDPRTVHVGNAVCALGDRLACMVRTISNSSKMASMFRARLGCLVRGVEPGVKFYPLRLNPTRAGHLEGQVSR